MVIVMKLTQRIPYSMLRYVFRDVLPRSEWQYTVTILVRSDEEEILKRRLETVTFETYDELVMFLKQQNYEVEIHGYIMVVSDIRPSDDCHTYS
jgi:thioester reductase-like protein